MSEPVTVLPNTLYVIRLCPACGCQQPLGFGETHLSDCLNRGNVWPGRDVLVLATPWVEAGEVQADPSPHPYDCDHGVHPCDDCPPCNRRHLDAVLEALDPWWSRQSSMTAPKAVEKLIAERDRLRAALAVAADDLDAAVQCVRGNPAGRLFPAKAARARRALEGRDV